MPEKKTFRITTSLSQSRFESDLVTEVELFKEGSWKHQSAPGGWFTVDKDRIQSFINNFNRGVCGYEIPLEFNHLPDSKSTPGWITSMFEIIDENGISHLKAKMKLTDREVAQRIRDGSLKYISPTVVSDYVDTASGKEFEVIRSATLTNYPHIKNLNPISVNFEEIKHREEGMKDLKELLEKEDLQLEDLESITLEDIDSGDIDLENLTADRVKLLAEHFEMTPQQFQDKYPGAGANTYGATPKIRMPAGVPAERKEEFLAAFAAAFKRVKNVPQAMALTMKKLNLEEDSDKTFKEKIVQFADAVSEMVALRLGKKKADLKFVDPDVDTITLEDMQKKISGLEAYKIRKETEEDSNFLLAFETMTPAVKKVAQTLLTIGRSTVLKFEEKEVSLHDLVVSLFEELGKSPSENMFIKKSHTERTALDMEDKELDTKAKAYMEEHPNATYRQALDFVYQEINKAKQQ